VYSPVPTPASLMEAKIKRLQRQEEEKVVLTKFCLERYKEKYPQAGITDKKNRLSLCLLSRNVKIKI
jgi:hypothetical protein